MQVTLIEVFLICTAVSCWFYWLWGRHKFYKFALKFPCLWGLPLVGIFLYVGSINNLLPYLTKYLGRSKCRTFCVWLSITPMILTVDPKVVEQVLTAAEFLAKAQVFYKPVEEALSGGLIALPLEKWQAHRKIVAPTFRHKQLLSFMPIFNVKSKDFLHLLEDMSVAGGGHRLLNSLRLCLVSMSKETTMGHTINETGQNMTEVLEQLIFTIRHVALELILNCANLRFLIKFNPIYVWTKKKLYNFSNEIISYRAKSILHESTEVTISKELNTKNEPQIFIEQALKFHKTGELSWADIIGESNGILVASFETTSSTVFSVLVLLAMHPKVQERLYEEIVAAFPTKDFQVQYDDLRNLHYLEMVINETLRLFPPAPLIARHTTKSTSLAVNGRGYRIPTDMQVAISIYHMHREPSIWGPHANRFDPDNFLPHNVNDRHSYAFIPFSKGPRNCIGWTYAYLSVKVLLAHILRNYRVTTDFKYEDIKVNLSLFLEYRVEPLLEFQRRE